MTLFWNHKFYFSQIIRKLYLIFFFFIIQWNIFIVEFSGNQNKKIKNENTKKAQKRYSRLKLKKKSLTSLVRWWKSCFKYHYK